MNIKVIIILSALQCISATSHAQAQTSPQSRRDLLIRDLSSAMTYRDDGPTRPRGRMYQAQRVTVDNCQLKMDYIYREYAPTADPSTASPRYRSITIPLKYLDPDRSGSIAYGSGLALYLHANSPTKILNSFGSPAGEWTTNEVEDLEVRVSPRSEEVVMARIREVASDCTGTANSSGPAEASQAWTIDGSLDHSDPKKLPNEDHYDDYGYEVVAGQRLRIELISNDFDTWLSIGRNGGTEYVEITSDDDGAGGTNSRLDYTFHSSGKYTIRVSALGHQTGKYTLTGTPLP